MLLFIVLTLLSVKFAQTLTINEELREAVEGFKALMPEGSEALGIPPLAPYQNDFMEWTFGNPEAKSSSYFNVSHFIVNGLDDFDVKVLDFFKLTSKVTYDFTFNDILFQGNYFANGNVTYSKIDFEARGMGDIYLLLQELRINGSFRLLPFLKGLRMTHFKIQVYLGNVKSKFTGVLNNKYATIFFNRWLEEFLTMSINEEVNQEIISQGLRDFIVPKVNSFLKNYTLVDLIRIILGLAGGSNESNLQELLSVE